VFNRSDSKVDALLHGHSYTAHPIGCAVAIETLRAVEALKQSSDWKKAQAQWQAGDKGVWSFWSKDSVEQLAALEGVDHAVAMGCVLKVAIKDSQGGYTSTAAVDVLKKLRYGKSASQGHPSVPTQQPEDEETLPYNVHARPLGNVIYLMSSLNTPPSVLRTSERVLHNALRSATS
jgi:dethiobiotin synthetase/adenosylmethionine--8-amino-7-oxononanoate aminotransferase